MSSMGFKELVAVSLCSQQSNVLVKTHRPRQLKNVCLRMITGRWPRALIYNSETMAREHVIGAMSTSELPSDNEEFIRINGFRVPVAFLRNGHLGLCLDTFWEDQELGLKTCIDYVSDLFGIHVSALSLQKNGIWSIEWLRNRQSVPLESVYFECQEHYSDEEFAFVLRSYKQIKDLGIHAKPSETFRYTETLKIDKFVLQPSHWITLHNLITLDSIAIKFALSKLTNADLNTFLCHWITAESSRLEYMSIGIENVDIVQILEHGLEGHVEELHEETIYRRGHGPPSFFMIIWPEPSTESENEE